MNRNMGEKAVRFEAANKRLRTASGTTDIE